MPWLTLTEYHATDEYLARNPAVAPHDFLDKYHEQDQKGNEML
jgi:hypothetical protein